MRRRRGWSHASLPLRQVLGSPELRRSYDLFGLVESRRFALQLSFERWQQPPPRADDRPGGTLPKDFKVAKDFKDFESPPPPPPSMAAPPSAPRADTAAATALQTQALATASWLATEAHQPPLAQRPPTVRLGQSPPSRAPPSGARLTADCRRCSFARAAPARRPLSPSPSAAARPPPSSTLPKDFKVAESHPLADTASSPPKYSTGCGCACASLPLLRSSTLTSFSLSRCLSLRFRTTST